MTRVAVQTTKIRVVEYGEEIPERARAEILQKQIRHCVRTIISELDGKWTNAQGISELAKTKYPHLAKNFCGKSVGEYLKHMSLKTKTIEATLYLCRKQFADV